MKHIDIINPRIAPGGIRLRDYFAAKAMHGFLVSGYHHENVATYAYLLTDAMLQQREKDLDKWDPIEEFTEDSTEDSKIEVGDLVRYKSAGMEGEVAAVGLHDGTWVNVFWEDGLFHDSEVKSLEIIKKRTQKSPIEVGDIVRLKGYEREGEVTEVGKFERLFIKVQWDEDTYGYYFNHFLEIVRKGTKQ